jgi:hypothetical protein
MKTHSDLDEEGQEIQRLTVQNKDLLNRVQSKTFHDYMALSQETVGYPEQNRTLTLRRVQLLVTHKV